LRPQIVASDALDRIACAYSELSVDETAAFRVAWRRVYARPLKRTHGVWHRGKYDWHIFSFKDTFAFEGHDAREAYLSQPRSKLIIVPNGPKDSGCAMDITEPIPVDGKQDIYVSPPSGWTVHLSFPPRRNPIRR
jgi:hypothetical protein